MRVLPPHIALVWPHEGGAELRLVGKWLCVCDEAAQRTNISSTTNVVITRSTLIESRLFYHTSLPHSSDLTVMAIH